MKAFCSTVRPQMISRESWACPHGAGQVTCGNSQSEISDFKRALLKHPRVAYLSTPRHLSCAILFLSRQDKAAFIAFRSFNESNWPCQQGFLSFKSNLRPFFAYNFHSAFPQSLLFQSSPQNDIETNSKGRKVHAKDNRSKVYQPRQFFGE